MANLCAWENKQITIAQSTALTYNTNGLPSEQLLVKKHKLADVEQHLDIYKTKRINYIINLEISLYRCWQSA